MNLIICQERVVLFSLGNHVGPIIMHRGQNHLKVDLVEHGFSCTVTRYSAIDNVLDRLRNTPVNDGVELKYLGSKVLELTNELESTRHRQIDCNRYSQDFFMHILPRDDDNPRRVN